MVDILRRYPNSMIKVVTSPTEGSQVVATLQGQQFVAPEGAVTMGLRDVAEKIGNNWADSDPLAVLNGLERVAFPSGDTSQLREWLMVVRLILDQRPWTEVEADPDVQELWQRYAAAVQP